MDLNLTVTLATNTSLIQPVYSSAVIAAASVIIGAVITGGLTLIRDILNRIQDRNDNRNELIGSLKGQKDLILQYYAFYFFSFINRGYLSCRSTIHAMHEIDYKYIYSVPEEKRNREIMRMMDKSCENSIEYKGCSEDEAELKKWKEELAKSNKILWTTIGKLQNYYSNDSVFDELCTKIETDIENYAQLEKTIMNGFDSIIQEVQNITGRIPQEAYEKESRIDPTLNNRWASLGDRKMDILLPRINNLQHDYLRAYIKKAEDIRDELREKRESVSDTLNDSIEVLIKEYKKQKNGKCWQFWKRI
jgi:hypothetical protein